MQQLSTQAPPRVSRSTLPARRRILIVEDDPDVARLVARVLRSRFDVRVYADATEALTRVFAGDRFDVILCDMQMPSMEGVALYEAIAILDAAQARRFVFLTGCTHEEMADRAPGVDVLRKPFSLDELREVIGRRLRA